MCVFYQHANTQVILFVCDGAKPNRKFLKSMVRESEMKHRVVYKTVNRFYREKFIYFMSDVPHLIKTTRNCWYSSKTGRLVVPATCGYVLVKIRNFAHTNSYQIGTNNDCKLS